MRSTTTFAALAAGASVVSAQALQGFNYGATNSDGSIKDQQRYADEFKVAKQLVGTDGWASARLYTSIQGGTVNTPIAAIPAAIAEDTTILLGIWCSGGQDIVNNEIAAIKAAIEQYGDEFTSRVVGLSVGSEDLYRISPTGIAAESGYGAEPQDLVKYIGQARSALKGTGLENVKIGHVDTWNDWVNGSNSAVVDAVDWLGFDGYPYFQSTVENPIENAEALFDESYAATVAAAKGKDVWVTETGWPVSGPDYGKAEASLVNARKYWVAVACKLKGKVNTFWYTLQDAFPTTPAPSFGVVGTELSTTPLYDLSCPADGGESSSSSAAASSVAASSTSADAQPTETETDEEPTGVYPGGGSQPTDEAEASTAQTIGSTGKGVTYSTGVANTLITVPYSTSGIDTLITVPSVTKIVSSPTGYVTAPTGTAGTVGQDQPSAGPGSGPGANGNNTVVTPTAPSNPSGTGDESANPAFTGGAVKAAAPFMAGAVAAVMGVMAFF